MTLKYCIRCIARHEKLPQILISAVDNPIPSDLLAVQSLPLDSIVLTRFDAGYLSTLCEWYTGMAPSSSSIWQWNRCVSTGVTPLPQMTTTGSLGSMHNSLKSTKQRLPTISMANPRLSGLSIAICSQQAFGGVHNLMHCDDNGLNCLFPSLPQSFPGVKPLLRP